MHISYNDTAAHLCRMAVWLTGPVVALGISAARVTAPSGSLGAVGMLGAGLAVGNRELGPDSYAITNMSNLTCHN